MSLDPTLGDVSRKRGVDDPGLGISPDVPELSQGLRPMALADLPRVVHLFRDVFPSSPLSRCGPGFLFDLLSSYVAFPGGCGYVYVQDGEVVGFVVGAEDSRKHRRDLLRRRWASLLRQIFVAAVRSPSIARSLGRYLRAYLVPRHDARSGRPRADTEIPAASLVFLGVAPAHRRGGVASLLTEAFLRELTARGADRVKLTVAAANQGAVRFYLMRGWQVAGCFPSPTGEPTYRLIHGLPAESGD